MTSLWRHKWNIYSNNDHLLIEIWVQKKRESDIDDKNKEQAERVKLAESLDNLRQAYRLKRTEFEIDIANLKSRDFVHTSEATRVTTNSKNYGIHSGVLINFDSDVVSDASVTS